MSDEYVWVKTGEGREVLVEKSKADLASAIEKLRGRHGHRGIGGAKVFLTQAEKRSIYNYTGVQVDDAQHARRVMKEKNLSFSEKGSADDDRIEALLDSARSGRPLDEKHGFGSIDLFGDRAQEEARARAFKENVQARYEYHRSQAARTS